MGTRISRSRRGRLPVAIVGVVATALALVPAGHAAAQEPPPPLVPPVAVGGNPTPLTDLFASTLPPLTGGTVRPGCATSRLGIPVTCVENVPRMPSAAPNTAGVTFGHWIYCRQLCVGSLLVHEMVHVHQFETYGDLFGPMYLVEAAQHGTGCDNQWERPAYQTGGTCH